MRWMNLDYTDSDKSKVTLKAVRKTFHALKREICPRVCNLQLTMIQTNAASHSNSCTCPDYPHYLELHLQMPTHIPRTCRWRIRSPFDAGALLLITWRCLFYGRRPSYIVRVIMRNAFAKEWLTSQCKLIREPSRPNSEWVDGSRRFRLGRNYQWMPMPRGFHPPTSTLSLEAVLKPHYG